MSQHLESGAKYSGSSVAVGSALAVITGYFLPNIKADFEMMAAVQALYIFVINLILVRVFKGS